MRINLYLFLVIVCILLAFSPLLRGYFFYSGDMRDVFIPLEKFFRSQQLVGQIPSWNPNIAWGFPVIASAQIGYFYPPLLLGRFLPLQIYLPLIFMSHLIFLTIGTYFFVRRLGQSKTSSSLSALSFALGAYVIQHASHLNIILTLSWLPWQLLIAHTLASRKKFNFLRFTLFVLTLSFPFLAGQIQIPLLTSGFSSLFYLWLSLINKKTFFKPTLYVLSAAVLVVALASCQLLPTYELTQFSSRANNNDFDIIRANQHSFPLYHLPTLLFPRFFGNDSTYWGKRLQIEYGIYIGAIPLILSLWIIFKQIKSNKPVLPYGRFWLFAAIASFLLALGNNSPFRLIGLEPSLWIFSAPARWLLFTCFSLSIMSGFGLDILSNKNISLRSFQWFIVIFFAFIIGFNLLLLLPATTLADYALDLIKAIRPEILTGRDLTYYQNKLLNLVVSAKQDSISLSSLYTIIPLVSILSFPFIFNRKRGRQVILGVTIFELIIFANSTNPTTPWTKILNPPSSLKQLPNHVLDKSSRLHSLRPSGGDTGALLTNPSSRADKETRNELRKLLVPLVHSQFDVAGIEWPASLFLSSHVPLLDQLRTFNKSSYNLDLARSLNIGAVTAPASMPLSNINPVSKSQDVLIYDLGENPRAILCSSENKCGVSASYSELNPKKISINTDSPQDTTLLVKDNWFPGWLATIDGLPATIEKSNSIFKSIKLPPGQHTVTMEYRPRSLETGLFISLTTITILITINLLLLQTKSKHP